MLSGPHTTVSMQGAISADPVQGANDLLARINEQLDQLGIHGAPSSSWPGSLGQSHSSNAPISIHSSVAGGAKELDGDVTSPLVPEVLICPWQSWQHMPFAARPCWVPVCTALMSSSVAMCIAAMLERTQCATTAETIAT